jgi:hypothetical protein
MSIEKIMSGAGFRSARGRHGFRPAKLLPWLFAAAVLTGCARRYDITLTNGDRVTNVTRPVLDRQSGVFTYKDVAGNEHQVHAGHVVEIDPHSSKNSMPGSFQSKTAP